MFQSLYCFSVADEAFFFQFCLISFFFHFGPFFLPLTYLWWVSKSCFGSGQGRPSLKARIAAIATLHDMGEWGQYYLTGFQGKEALSYPWSHEEKTALMSLERYSETNVAMSASMSWAPTGVSSLQLLLVLYSRQQGNHTSQMYVPSNQRLCCIRCCTDTSVTEKSIEMILKILIYFKKIKK